MQLNNTCYDNVFKLVCISTENTTVITVTKTTTADSEFSLLPSYCTVAIHPQTQTQTHKRFPVWQMDSLDGSLQNLCPASPVTEKLVAQRQRSSRGVAVMSTAVTLHWGRTGRHVKR